MSNNTTFEIESLGVLTPRPVEIGESNEAQLRFFAANIKNVTDTKIGDTITEVSRSCVAALPGFEARPSRSSSPVCTRSIRMSTPCCATRWSCDSTIPPSFLSQRVPFRAGLRLSLRLFRPAPHGDYSRSGWSAVDLDPITTPPAVRYRMTDGGRMKTTPRTARSNFD